MRRLGSLKIVEAVKIGRESSVNDARLKQLEGECTREPDGGEKVELLTE